MDLDINKVMPHSKSAKSLCYRRIVTATGLVDAEWRCAYTRHEKNFRKALYWSNIYRNTVS